MSTVFSVLSALWTVADISLSTVKVIILLADLYKY